MYFGDFKISLKAFPGFRVPRIQDSLKGILEIPRSSKRHLQYTRFQDSKILVKAVPRFKITILQSQKLEDLGIWHFQNSRFQDVNLETLKNSEDARFQDLKIEVLSS